MRHFGEELSSYNRKGIADRAKDRFSGPAVAARLTEEYDHVLAGEDSVENPA
jgi:hypothetical protein